MSPQIALLAYVSAIVVLFVLARDREVSTSRALWIPVAWLAIGGSRNVSQWFDSELMVDSNRYMEGNALDRNVLTGLLVLGAIVLVRRGFQVGTFVQANTAVALYFAYCGLSVVWSDYSDVAFKRWIRGLGDLVMVLVVLTDGDQLTAIKRFLTRAGWVLLPLSILMIRYYPDKGRIYDRWSGTPSWTGVGTDKNMLGMICLVFGLACLWHFLRAYGGDASARRRGPMIANVVILAVTISLFQKANSATAVACFVLAGAVMVLTSRPALARSSGTVHLLVVTVLSVVVGALFFNTGSSLVETMGRDATITGRTEMWRILLGMQDSPLLGSGYESFWLGDRLEQMAKTYYNHPNQAHNGYIEVFLNLGWVGVILVAAVLVTGYRHVVAAVRRQIPAANLALAYFLVAVMYNFTEGAVKMMHPVWITFLMATIVVPAPLAAAALVRNSSNSSLTRQRVLEQ